jgi:hypothetical protein
VTVTRPLLRVGATLRQGADELAFTLAPGLDDTPWLAPAALLVAVLAVVVIAWSRRRGLDPRARAMHQVAGLVASCYLGLVILAKTFVGHGIPLDQRILSPLLLCGALALVPAVRLGLARWPPAVRLLAWLGIAAWLGGALVSVKDLDDDISVNGYDFAESGWRHSETLAWLRREGAAFALYTNHPVPIYYYLHRPSRDLPARLAPDTLRQFAERFAARPSALVAFADTTWGDAVPARILAQALSLREAAHLADGTVWLSPVSAGSSSPPPDRPRGPASARHR